MSGWQIVYGGMLTVAITMNLIVIWIIICHASMRNVANYFLAHLALSDLAMCVFNCAFNLDYMIYKNWKFGYGYCMVNNFMSLYTVAASVFSLLALTLERYYVVMMPLRPKPRRVHALGGIILVICLSSLLCLPTILYTKIGSTSSLEPGSTPHTVCFLLWPDGIPFQSKQDFWYNVSFCVVTYFLPVTIMGYSYTRVGLKLWGQEKGLEETYQSEAVLRIKHKKRKIVKMSLVVVILFAVCWLPYHMYFMAVYLFPDIRMQPWLDDLYLGVYLMAMSTSLINPTVYYLMNRKFQNYFHQALCINFCFKSRNGSNERNESYKDDNQNNSRLMNTSAISIRKPLARRTTQISAASPFSSSRETNSNYQIQVEIPMKEVNNSYLIVPTVTRV